MVLHHRSGFRNNWSHCLCWRLLELSLATVILVFIDPISWFCSGRLTHSVRCQMQDKHFLEDFLWQLSKLIMVVYVLLRRMSGKFQRESTVIFTIMLFLFIIYSHYEVGFYKFNTTKKYEFVFLYISLTSRIACIQPTISKEISQPFIFLIPLILIFHQVCQWVIII